MGIDNLCGKKKALNPVSINVADTVPEAYLITHPIIPRYAASTLFRPFVFARLPRPVVRHGL